MNLSANLSVEDGQRLYEQFLVAVRPVAYSDKLKQPLRSRTVQDMQVRTRLSNAQALRQAVESAFEEQRRVWAWSDTHFGHANIIQYCDRPFASMAEMNEAMYANYLATVQDGDLVLWDGDVSFGNLEAVKIRLRTLPGEKLLVFGNHEFDRGGFRDHKVFDLEAMSFVFTDKANGREVLVTHVPVQESNLPNGVINLHGHTHRELEGPRHINLSVEHHNFRPVDLRALLDAHASILPPTKK
jgi:calcineurin-like phosphoesterase family protein